jgi:methyl-accepting chemotaxis protein
MQMDHVTQRNAALVEEAAAAAESMQQQAQALTRAVSVFKLAQASEAFGRPETPRPKLDELPATAHVERRGPNRAKNVLRLPSQPKPEREVTGKSEAVRTGTDEWSEF